MSIYQKNTMTIERKRHLLKTISYRVISTTTGFIILWVVTGNVKIGAAFSTAELVFKPFIYYLHERFYYKFIKYGVKS
jgi:hypothetical protein